MPWELLGRGCGAGHGAAGPLDGHGLSWLPVPQSGMICDTDVKSTIPILAMGYPGPAEIPSHGEGENQKNPGVEEEINP